MGKLDVHISHGSSGIPKEVLIVGAGALLLFGGGGAVAASVASAVTMLLLWVGIAVGVCILAAVVLMILFRKRILANFQPTQVVWKSNTHADPPKPTLPRPESSPRVIEHRHYHHIVAPPGMPGVHRADPAWDRLVEAEILPSELED